MQVLIARYPVEASWLNFPFFYADAVEGLRAFARVDQVVIADPDKPLGENVDLEPYDGVVSFGGEFTADCLAKAPRLRVVAGFKAGQEAIEAAGVQFVALEGGWVRSVAELGICLTLSCLRRVGMWHSRIQAGHETWIMQQATDDPNFVHGELYGKRVGIFGFGRIGQYYARLARAFGAQLAASDPYVAEDIFAEAKVTPMDLDDLLTWSQIFVVASSATPESRGVIDRERVGKLKEGSALVVISRAWPLDMAAVRDRVEAGEICGAFDVFDREPMAPDDVLRRSPNVTLTPHIAGRCADANRLMAKMVVDAFREALKE